MPSAPRAGDESQVSRADLAQPGQRGARRAARGQHRVHDEHDRVRDALRQRLVVAVRPQRLLVAAHAEMADGRVGHQPQEPLDHPESGAKHRDDHDRLSTTFPDVVSSGVSTSMSRCGRPRVAS